MAKFKLEPQNAKKINCMLSKGYYLISSEQFQKKMPKPKKPIFKMPIPSKKEIIEQYAPKAVKQAQRRMAARVSQPLPTPTPSKKQIQTVLMKEGSQGGQPNYFISSKAVFERLKQHQAIHTLGSARMMHLEITYADIIEKCAVQEDYPIEQFEEDVSKICKRIYQSYHTQTEQYKNATNIQKFLKQILRESRAKKKELIDAHLAKIAPEIPSKPSSVQNISNQAQTAKKKPSIKPETVATNSVVTMAEKRALGRNIKKLPSEYLQEVCLIVCQNLENSEYTIDLDTLHAKKLRQLQEYVKKWLQNQQDRDMLEGSEDEYSNESSFVIENDDSTI